MKNSRATLDSFKVRPDEKGPVVTMTIKARCTLEELADLYGLLLAPEGAIDITMESKQEAFAN